MKIDWGSINKALREHMSIHPSPIPVVKHHYAYNPERLNYADFLKAEERRQEMNGDLFTKNETDIALLRRCIEEKWIPIYKGTKTDRGTKNCPLCEKYEVSLRSCMSCPIQEDTGRRMCRETPYDDLWINVAGINHFADTPEKKLAALQEILYLEGLIAKLTKAEVIEKEKQEAEAQATAEKAKIEQERKVYHPFVYYVTLEEPIRNTGMRLHIQKELIYFLKQQGLKVKEVRYSFGSGSHLMLNTKTGEWMNNDDLSLIT